MVGMMLPKPVRVPKKRRPIRRRATLGAKRRAAKAAGRVDPDTWQAVIAFYGFRCGICEVAPWQEQGHARALSRGGAHSIENVFPICRRDNQAQGTKTWWPRRRHPWMEKQ